MMQTDVAQLAQSFVVFVMIVSLFSSFLLITKHRCADCWRWLPAALLGLTAGGVLMLLPRA